MALLPRLPQALGALVLLNVLVVAGWQTRRVLTPPQDLDPHPPLDPAAADAWLAQRPPLNREPIPNNPEWGLLAHNPAMARWYRHSIAPDRLTPAGAAGIAIHSLPSALLDRAEAHTGLDKELVALSLHPDLARRVVQACPRLRPGIGDLCRSSPAREARNRADIWLVAELWSGDSGEALWALDTAAQLDGRGVEIAHRLLAEGPPLARARAVVVLSWAGGRESIPELRELLEDEGELVPLVAAVELGRLGAEDAAPDLVATRERLAGTGDAVLVEYARRMALGELYDGGPSPGL